MKAQNFELVRYDADEGKVFDWKNLDEHKSIIEHPKTGEKKDSLIILGTLVSLFAYGFFRKTDKKRDNY